MVDRLQCSVPACPVQIIQKVLISDKRDDGQCAKDDTGKEKFSSA